MFDVILLRMHALCRSKILTSYFVILALARSATFLVGNFLPQSGGYDVFKLDAKFELISVSIGTVFGMLLRTVTPECYSRRVHA